MVGAYSAPESDGTRRERARDAFAGRSATSSAGAVSVGLSVSGAVVQSETLLAGLAVPDGGRRYGADRQYA